MAKKLKSLSAVARALGVSSATVVRQARTPGFPPKEPDGYDLGKIKAFRRERGQLNKAAPGGEYGGAMTRKMVAQARTAELELAKLEGSLLDKAEVERRQRDFVQVVTNGLLNAPAPLSLLVANKPPASCAKVLKEYFRRMLDGWRKLDETEA
jgi:hypothetical protein